MGEPSPQTSASDMTGTASAMVAVRLLGPLDVRLANAPVRVRAPQERALLALLLTAPGRVFAVADIVAGLWGVDPPRRADKTVQT
jgi:DNA-binding SARP family transcriptional activator